MRSSTVQGQTLGVALFLAAAAFLVASVAGYASAGSAVATGLVIGSINGFLVQSTLDHRAPILVTSFMRLALFSAVAFGVASLTRMPIMPLVGGIALAQIVMFGVGVRQGLRL